MSIGGALQRAHRAGHLDFTPMDRSDPSDRVLMYGSEIRELFAGPFVGKAQKVRERRAQELLADFQAFVRGDHVSLCLRPREHVDSTFGRLEPPDLGIWDFRSRDPSPSLRVFGAFAGADIFVAFNWWPRWKKLAWSEKEPLLDDDDRWAAAINDAEGKWRQILLGRKRVTGDEVRNYVTGNFSVF